MLPSDATHPADEALGHYLRGLALLAKSDVHAQFDLNIFQEFHLALREGMRAYGEWDASEPFPPVFERFGSRFFTDPGDRHTYVGAVELAEEGRPDEVKLNFTQAVMMKGLTDASFLPRFRELASKRAASEDAEATGD